jgi:hypothetical protein
MKELIQTALQLTDISRSRDLTEEELDDLAVLYCATTKEPWPEDTSDLLVHLGQKLAPYE